MRRFSRPSLCFNGLPANSPRADRRKGWEVADVQELAGCGKVRAEKGSLVVWGGGGEELYRVGPEARPFPMLGAADWEAVAQEVKGKLA